MVEFVISGAVPTKKNLLFKGKYGQLYRPNQVTEFEKSSFYELKQQMSKLDIQFPIYPRKVEIIFYVKRQKDIDNLLGAIFDVIQKVGIIANDNQIADLKAKKVKKTGEEISIIRIWS